MKSKSAIMPGRDGGASTLKKAASKVRNLIKLSRTKAKTSINRTGRKRKPDTYICKGRTDIIDLNDVPFKIYFIGKENCEKCIIFVTDIFGWNKMNKNCFRVCDLLHEKTGCNIIMPDFFGKNKWPLKDYPPKNMEHFAMWEKEFADCECVCGHIKKIVRQMQKQYYHTSFGILGASFGGLLSVSALAATGMFKAAGGFHPGILTNRQITAEQLSTAKCPILLVEAIGGPKMPPLQLLLDKKFHPRKCPCKVYPYQRHGFITARGNWADPKVESDAMDAIEMASAFFKTLMR